MNRKIPAWVSVLVAITVAILLGKSIAIFRGPLLPRDIGLQLVELAGRNAAMLVASLLALVTQRREYFVLLCVMGVCRESWDFGNVVYFDGFRPGSLGLLAFVGIWLAALWTLRNRPVGA